MSAYTLPRVTTVTERDRNAFPKHMDKKIKRKKKKLMKEVGDVWGEIQSLTPHCHLYILGTPFRGSTWGAVLLVQPV